MGAFEQLPDQEPGQASSQPSLFGEIGPSALAGAGLLVMASGRIVSALVCTMALLWINTLTLCILSVLKKNFPADKKKSGGFKVSASGIVLAFVSSWMAFFFFFMVWLLSPFTAMESAFFIVLCPAFLSLSDVSARLGTSDAVDMILQAVSGSLALGVLVLAVALIREPLGSGTFSFPGFGIARWTDVNPLAVLQASSGALILLGYLLALYRRFGNRRLWKDK